MISIVPVLGEEQNSVTLTFTVSPICAGEPMGILTVPIQVADVVLSLPGTIAVGQVIDLDDSVTVTRIDPNDVVALFTVTPDTVERILNANDNTLQVMNGVGNTLTVSVDVFGTAGMLASTSGTIEIIAAP